jgi:hypothetical protein
MAPCVVEAAEKPERVLFATPCNAVEYSGQAPRPWKAAELEN